MATVTSSCAWCGASARTRSVVPTGSRTSPATLRRPALGAASLCAAIAGSALAPHLSPARRCCSSTLPSSSCSTPPSFLASLPGIVLALVPGTPLLR
jgi:hypothetical protein